MFRTTSLAVAALAMLAVPSMAQVDGFTSGTYNPDTGGFRQLFVDDYRIESMRDAQRILHPGVKRPQPVLAAEKPWEKDAVYLYGTVLYDSSEHLYKMWYQTFHKQPPDAYILYATSKDSLRWQRPELGLVEWEGSRLNNILMAGEIATVVKDQAASDPLCRYKMLVFQRPGYHAYFSPDGIHWTKSAVSPVIPNGDVSNVMYDPYSARFVAMTKQPHVKGRAVFVSYSTDFEHWTSPTAVLVSDDRDQAAARAEGAGNVDVYGMAVTPYEGCFIGFPWMFKITGQGARDTGGDGRIDVQLAISRDLEHWSRLVRDPIIPRGLAGSFDDEMLFTSSAPVIKDQQISVYYGAWDGPHGTFSRKAYIGLATWRLDRFVSISNAGHTPGELVTKPLLVDNRELRVNADFSYRSGALRAEILDEDHRVVPGFSADECNPIRGDTIDSRVTWRNNSDLRALEGRTLRLRFVLSGGHLFSFCFR